MLDKHLIFLVHGMGEQGADWHEAPVQVLRQRYNALPRGGAFIPFDDTFEVVPILYDDVFEQIRDQWRTSGGRLSAAVSGVGVPITGAVVRRLDDLARIADEDEFLNTHLLDVVLYRYVEQLKGEVRDRVSVAILRELEKQAQQGRLQWSVIAHSLGTAVIHDALQQMYTDPANLQQLERMTFARVLAMVANVSRILEDEWDVYESLVRPGAPEPGCAVRHYLNVSHEWDPIPAAKRFRPGPQWPSFAIRELGLYQPISIAAVGQANVHDFVHYLENPRVYCRLFNAMVGKSDRPVVTEAEIDDLHEEYAGTLRSELFAAAVAKAKPFFLPEEMDTFDHVKVRRAIAAWLGYLA